MHSLTPTTTAPTDSDTAIIVRGACPLECCQYGAWRFRRAADVRAAPSDSATMVGRLPPGSRVTADSGWVIVDPVGIVVVLDDYEDESSHQRFTKGDTLFVLDYLGEGLVNVRWRDTTMPVQWTWDSAGTYGLKLLREPTSSWWAHVTTSHGLSGWVRMAGASVDGADACG